MLIKVFVVVGTVILAPVIIPFGVKNRLKWQKERIQKRADRLGFGTLLK